MKGLNLDHLRTFADGRQVGLTFASGAGAC